MILDRNFVRLARCSRKKEKKIEEKKMWEENSKILCK